MKIYVASSWRNGRQPEIVDLLREERHSVYDFRNPLGRTGFAWSEIDPAWQTWTNHEYRTILGEHPLALAGFMSDWRAMNAADVCVLLLPCGRSAHIEAGYFVGAGKPLVIYLDKNSEPELMYKMADALVVSDGELLHILRGIKSELDAQRGHRRFWGLK